MWKVCSVFWNRLTVHCTKLYTVFCGQLGESLEVPAYMALIRFYTEVGEPSKALELYDSLVHKARSEQFVSNSEGVSRYFMGIPFLTKLTKCFETLSYAWFQTCGVCQFVLQDGEKQCLSTREPKSLNWQTLQTSKARLKLKRTWVQTFQFDVHFEFQCFKLIVFTFNFKVRKSHPDWNGRFYWGFADRSKVTQASNRRTNEALPPLSCQRMQSTGDTALQWNSTRSTPLVTRSMLTELWR